jgi:hypothetical protein
MVAGGMQQAWARAVENELLPKETMERLPGDIGEQIPH